MPETYAQDFASADEAYYPCDAAGMKHGTNFAPIFPTQYLPVRTYPILLLAVSLFFLQCTTPDTETHTTTNTTDSTVQKKEKTPAPDPEPIDSFKIDVRYSLLPMTDSGRKAFKEFPKEEQNIILSLSRLDARHISKDTLVIPDTFAPDLRSYAPFPFYVPVLKVVHKMVVFSYPAQAFAAYEQGRLVRWGPTSLGKKSTPTPTGLFFANWKARETISTVSDEWKLKWNFNIWNKGGVGWHEYAMPGYPASHSCLRLLEPDAKFLYDFAHMWILKNNETLLAQGTPVLVYGEYPWGMGRPWLKLANDPKALDISKDELSALIEPHLENILKKQAQRDSVVAARTTPATSATPEPATTTVPE